MPAYSSTPLARKLGLKSGFSAWLFNAPVHYLELFTDWPEEVQLIKDLPAAESVDFIHFFVQTQDQLVASLPALQTALKKNGLLWVSWPKGRSALPTDLKRDWIRTYILDQGLVDIKVASVDDDWSGLKFVYRLKDR